MLGRKMTEGGGERIGYHESPFFEVARALREGGYELATSSRMRVSGPDGLASYSFGGDCIGILKPTDSRQIEGKMRALSLGTIWFQNEVRGAKYDSRWVVEVHGRDNVPEVSRFFEKFPLPTGVFVELTLDSERPKYEFFVTEYNM